MRHWVYLFQALPSEISLLFLLSFVLLGTAIVFSLYRKFKTALIFTFLTSIFLGISFALINPFLGLWDEQFHALVAKNMAENMLHPKLYPATPLPYAYQDWTANHTWLHKPPLSLWQMALFIKWFGNELLVVRLPSVILLALMAFPIFRIGKLTVNAQVGSWSAIVFCCLHYPLELVAGVHTADHIDIAFMAYITFSIWAFIEYQSSRKMSWLLLIGIFAGAAVLTKWLVGLLVFSGYGFILLFDASWRSSRIAWLRFLMTIGITLLLFLPWQFYTWKHYPAEFLFESGYSAKHFTEVIEGHKGNTWFYWKNLHLLYGNGIIIKLIVLMAWLSFSWLAKKKQMALSIQVLTIVPYLFFSMAATKMNSFLVIVAPIIIIQVTTLIHFVSSAVLNQLKTPIPLIRFAPLLFLICLAILRPREIYHNHWFTSDETKKVRSEWIQTHQFIRQQSFPPNQKIVVHDANQILKIHVPWMFYHDNLIAYRQKLSKEEIRHLQEQNYRVFRWVK